MKSIMKLLTKNHILYDKDIFEILDIKEIEHQEYMLTLKLGNTHILKNIYVNTELKLEKGLFIKVNHFSLFKSGLEIYLKIERFYIHETEDEEEINTTCSNIDEKNNSLIIYDFGPNNLLNFFTKIDNKIYQYYEDIFIIKEISGEKIKLMSPINLEYFFIEKKYIDSQLDSKNEVLYIKNFLMEDKDIICNNLTIIITDDYQIFHLLESKINNESNSESNSLVKEIKPILSFEQIKINYLLVKVVLKDLKKKQIKVIDTFDRIIELEYESFKHLNLFDILFITDCQIQKSKIDDFTYNLTLTSESFVFVSKDLYFDKRIKLNNYTLLDIYYLDFNEKNNLYNIINFENHNLNISNKHQIYKFFFQNEPFNEIVPFPISLKNEKADETFKFLITHNVLNKINIFINYINKEKCCKDYCYQNLYQEVPFSFNQKIDDKEYEITNYNAFDSLNRISFILINAPIDENINEINSNKSNNNIISGQIWFCAHKNYINEEINYILVQILDINEARKIKYSNYNLKTQNYLIFENFYFDIAEKIKSKNFDVFEYNDEFAKNVKNYEDIYNLLHKQFNIEFFENSVDYLSFKIYIGISLFDSIIIIEKEKKGKSKELMLNEFDEYFKEFEILINKLSEKKNGLTYHEKMRIINCFNFNYFNCFDHEKKKIDIIFFDEMNEFKSYKLAFNFNINIIKDLTEKSALTQGFLQLDSYILTNYFLDSTKKTYTLTNEPLIIMKNHLLSNYDNFLFIFYENHYHDSIRKACQNIPNRITCINEKSIFNRKDSQMLNGKDNALPISIEFFHEKDSHSKKNLKNAHSTSPVYCCKNSDIDVLEEPEDGKFIESIIGNKALISDLKNPANNLGELMKVEYFIKDNFEELNKRYNDLMANRVHSNSESFSKINFEETDKIKHSLEDQKIKKKEESELKTLEDFENYYLINGKFIYPDSLPFHHHIYGENPQEISKGEKEYLEKYKNAIKISKDAHYNKEINFCWNLEDETN